MSSVHYTQTCVLCLLCAGSYTVYLHCQVLSCTQTHRQTEASWLCRESAICSDLCNPGLGWLPPAPTSPLAQWQTNRESSPTFKSVQSVHKIVGLNNDGQYLLSNNEINQYFLTLRAKLFHVEKWLCDSTTADRTVTDRWSKVLLNDIRGKKI